MISKQQFVISSNTLNEIFYKVLRELRDFDYDLYSHSLRVGYLSHRFAKYLDYNQDDLNKIFIGATLHDIGKIIIPKSILNSTEKLTPIERDIIKLHPIYGYELLKLYCCDGDILRIVRDHHENINGSGYPYNALGVDISNFAMIVHIADVYDALINARSYKGPVEPVTVRYYLMANAGIQFDAYLVNKFVEFIKEHEYSDRELILTVC